MINKLDLVIPVHSNLKLKVDRMTFKNQILHNSTYTLKFSIQVQA